MTSGGSVYVPSGTVGTDQAIQRTRRSSTHNTKCGDISLSGSSWNSRPLAPKIRNILLPPNLQDQTRFWAKVDKSGECWIWLAAKNRDGYGTFSLGGQMFLSHRISWMIEHGHM